MLVSSHTDKMITGGIDLVYERMRQFVLLDQSSTYVIPRIFDDLKLKPIVEI